MGLTKNMNCSEYPSTSSPERGMLIIKAGSLIFVLVIVVMCNTLLVIRLSVNRRRWSPSELIIKYIAVSGVFNALINVTSYTVTLISGQWVLGDAMCQITGFLGAVLISSSTWLLAMGAFERFTKILLPAEYPSLFSEINTRIMVLGAMIILIAMFLSPVYGWGEYSFFRGKLDLDVRVRNVSAVVPEEKDEDFKRIAFTFYQTIAYLEQQNTTYSPLHQTKLYLTKKLGFVLRKIQISAEGITYPLRIPNSDSLDCFWDAYQSGLLVDQLTDMVRDTSLYASLGVHDLVLNVTIHQHSFDRYKTMHLIYQEAGTCGLDYTDVNPNVYSFVGFMWAGVIVIPYALMFISYCAVCVSGFQGLCCYSVEVHTVDDVHITKVFAYSAGLNFVLSMPYFVTNLLSGISIYVPPGLHFISTIMVYFNGVAPCAVYSIMVGCSCHCPKQPGYLLCSTGAEIRDDIQLFTPKRTILSPANSSRCYTVRYNSVITDSPSSGRKTNETNV